MLSLFEIGAVLLVLSASFGWFNERFIGLPHVIGLLVMALTASIALIGFDELVPGLGVRDTVETAVEEIDFYDTMMNGMLAFLLFAGALQVDLGRLRSVALPVGLMATIGVIISTAIVGVGFYLIARLIGIEMPLIWALVFGALISPTDPVAVLALLKSVDLPQRLEIKIAGESLFNDGVGVVLFTLLIGIATRTEELTFLNVGELFLWEAVGGIILGLVAGYVALLAMEMIDDYPIEILITLGLVAGLYAIAVRLHMSGPIAVVVAGILMGNRGGRTAMSESVRSHLFQFWEFIDELLNSVLFLLIGLEVLVVSIDPSLAGLAIATIPLVLFARFVAVSVPLSILSMRSAFTPGSIPILTWGGVRGGISVALALAVPVAAVREPILIATYAVVIFSIIVQGLTITPLVRRVVREGIEP
ncbi:MAG: sodium:proton antiporter [Hyphomicrobiales bacterium]|nr:sodium:proton antiporter [Hyphomicrobiales bacterium]